MTAPAIVEARAVERATSLEYLYDLHTAQKVSAVVAEYTSDWQELRTKIDQAFVTHDRQSGFAITADGELIGLFSLVKGRGDWLIRYAIAQGATHLDCFDGYLADLYRSHGFVVEKSEPNWTPGGPDVLYFRLPVTHLS